MAVAEKRHVRGKPGSSRAMAVVWTCELYCSDERISVDDLAADRAVLAAVPAISFRERVAVCLVGGIPVGFAGCSV